MSDAVTDLGAVLTANDAGAIVTDDVERSVLLRHRDDVHGCANDVESGCLRSVE